MHCAKKLMALAVTLSLLLTMGAGALASEEPVELVVFYSTTEPADQQMVVDAVNEILLEKHNIKIKTIVPNSANGDTQLTLMLTSNEQLDVFLVGTSRFGTDVANGSMYDMTDLLAEYGQGIVDAIGEKYLSPGQINGRQYAVTTFRDLAKGFSVYMRADLCDKYGIVAEEITTLEQLGEAFKIIKENEPDITPLLCAPTQTPSYRLNDVDQLGNLMGVLMNMGQDDLTVVNYYETEQFEHYVRTFREWYLAGYINGDDIVAKVEKQELMKAGLGFAHFDGSKPNGIIEEEGKGGQDLYEAPIIPGFTYTAAPQTAQWAIAAKTKHPTESIVFLNELYTNADIMNLFAWGIEGVHYEILEDGHIYYPEGVDASNSGYNSQRGWAFGNQALTHIWQGAPLTAWEDLAKYNEDAYVSKAFGFTWDSSDYLTEVAAVQSVFDEYRVPLEYGMLDPDVYLPIFQQALRDAGIDKIVASKQEQLNAWALANSVE